MCAQARAAGSHTKKNARTECMLCVDNRKETSLQMKTLTFLINNKRQFDLGVTQRLNARNSSIKPKCSGINFVCNVI